MSWMLVGVAAIAAFGAFAQMITGFGFALVGIPLLALLTDPLTAVVGLTMLSAALTVGAAAHQRHLVDWGETRAVTLAALIGLPTGLVVVKVVETRVLSVLIGIVVLVFTLVLASGMSARGRGVTATAGIVSGALLTSTGMNGPPIVLAFHAKRMSPASFRATLQAVFAVQDVLALAGFALIGLVGATVWTVTAVGAPAMILGWWIGTRVAGRINARRFRHIVLAMLVATAAVSLITGLHG